MNIPRLFSSLRTRPLLVAGALAIAGLLVGLNANPAGGKPSVEVKRDDRAVNRDRPEPASFSSVVKRVAPSVVRINTETRARRVSNRAGEGPAFDNPMFREFFGPRMMPDPRQMPQSGLGSGVIISADGFIVTNNHVIDGADRVMVTLDDGRSLPARVVGRDPQTDIAVVKVEAAGLPAVTFADSAAIEVGDRVLAIGNPFGIGETVTTGIVSAMGRRAGIGLAYEDFVQTDAAINPGNSGGALVDIEGRLIGINTAILSRSGGFQGVGLAVPANLVSQVTEGLVRNGKVVRGYLGVGAQDLTAALAEGLNLKGRTGALVTDVAPGTPAEKAGLESGDVIVAIDGKPIDDANRLTLTVAGIAPGTEVDLRVVRDGKERSLTLTTAERPRSLAGGRSDRFGGRDLEPGPADEGALRGVVVADIEPNTRRAMSLPARIQGAVITDVEPDSAAARAGLRPGDVILEIKGEPVGSADDAVELSRRAGDGRTVVKVWSRGSTVFVVVDETSEGVNR
jgi:serine protease Do